MSSVARRWVGIALALVAGTFLVLAVLLLSAALRDSSDSSPTVLGVAIVAYVLIGLASAVSSRRVLRGPAAR